MIEEKKKDEPAAKLQCKAILKTTGERCTKGARLGGYCLQHYMALQYKENRKLKKERKEKDRLEKLRKKQEERQKKWN